MNLPESEFKENWFLCEDVVEPLFYKGTKQMTHGSISHIEGGQDRKCIYPGKICEKSFSLLVWTHLDDTENHKDFENFLWAEILPIWTKRDRDRVK